MWFKVDDKFHVNRKTRRLMRLNPAKRRDCHAAGLWLFAGCWCMNTEAADGFVPADELEQFDDDWQVLSDQLVESELWADAEHKGEKGYQFLNWAEWQPIFELKAKRAEAGRVGGLASGKARRSKTKQVLPKQTQQTEASASADSGQATTEANAKQTRSKREANAKQNEANRTSSHPIPSHPIPEVPMADLVSQLQVVRADGKEFTIDGSTIARIKQLTGGDEEHVIKSARFVLDRAPGDVRNPGAYIVAAINEDPDAFKHHRRAPRRDEQCTEHPGEWADRCRGCAIDARLGD